MQSEHKKTTHIPTPPAKITAWCRILKVQKVEGYGPGAVVNWASNGIWFQNAGKKNMWMDSSHRRIPFFLMFYYSQCTCRGVGSIRV